jgi:phage repressor protein C with HTH and peptisase S24 domain
MDEDARLRALLTLLKDRFCHSSKRELGNRIGKDESYIGRLLYPPGKDGKKGIGQEIMRATREAFQLPLGFWELEPNEAERAITREPNGGVQVTVPESLRNLVPDGYIRLPVMAEAAAGDGREPLPEIVQYVDVLESYIRQRLGINPKTVNVLTARGSSMTGQIEDGDIMFVRPTNEFTDDGIYILSLDGLVRVKRLSISVTVGVVIIESNDGRQPEQLPLKEVPERLHIQGRVIAAWSLRRFP